MFVMFLLWILQLWTTKSFSWNPKHWDPGSLCCVCLPKAPTNVRKTSWRKWWKRKQNPQRKWSETLFLLLWYIKVGVWQKNLWGNGKSCLFFHRVCVGNQLNQTKQCKTTRRNITIIRYCNMNVGQVEHFIIVETKCTPSCAGSCSKYLLCAIINVINIVAGYSICDEEHHPYANGAIAITNWKISSDSDVCVCASVHVYMRTYTSYMRTYTSCQCCQIE